jgi:ribonuclease P protein subunit RPR2
MSKPLLSKDKQKEIAKQRVMDLFKQADEVFSDNKALANRYVKVARDIAMSVKLKMPREIKRKYCKHCYSYLKPGVNSRVRMRPGKIVIACLNCKKFMRIVTKPKKNI